MSPSESLATDNANAKAAAVESLTASLKAQNPNLVTFPVGGALSLDASGNVLVGAQQSGLVGSGSIVAAPATKKDRLSSILKGIAAIAAEVGPEFIHSSHGTAFLGAGELALQLLGEVL